MSFIPTAQLDVVKRPQFVEELVEGTLPLSNGATPTPGPVTFKTVGWGMTLGEDIAIENDKLRMLGSYDVEKQLKLGETITSEITYKPFDFKFAGYGLKKPIAPTVTPPDPTMVAPNGTSGVSISILMSALVEGIEKYKIFKGVKFGGCSGEITRDGGCTFTLPFQCKDVTGWVAAPTWVGSPNFAANPTATDPFTGISGGADPLTIATVAADSTSFSFNVDLGMMNYTPLGQSTFKYRKSMQRNMTVEFNALVKADNVMIGDVRNYTPRDVEYTFFPVTKKLKFTGVQFESYVQNKDANSTDFWIEELSGQASGDLVITDT